MASAQKEETSPRQEVVLGSEVLSELLKVRQKLISSFKEELRHQGVTLARARALLALSKEGDLTQTSIAAYLEMGAAGVQLGTRFVCATESIAHPNFKKAFIRASARDAVPSVQIDPRLPVIPVRALKNNGTEAFTAKQREVANMLDAGEVDMAAAVEFRQQLKAAAGEDGVAPSFNDFVVKAAALALLDQVVADPVTGRQFQ